MRFSTYLKIILVVFILAACGPGATPPAGADDSADKTQVAQTVQAILTAENSSQGGSQADPTKTVAPAAPTATPTPLPEDKKSTDDVAAFVADVTIPDYSNIETNADFTKTWRIQNTGNTTWTTEYKLIFESGEQMNGPDSIPFPKEVPPDGIIDLSIDFTAPAAAGEYRGNWLLENADGEVFGIGEDAHPIYVIILAVDPSSGSSGSSSGGGIAGGANITNATIGIDNANYAGSCPATLNLSGSITTSSSGVISWSLNLAATTSGFTFDPSGSYSLSYGDGGGTQYWAYTLFISNSVNANATLIVNGSNGYSTSPLSFSVTCQ